MFYIQSVEEIIGVLVGSGCPDLTYLIDPDATSTLPVAGGGFNDVFRGVMRDGTQIAIETFKDYEAYGESGSKKALKVRLIEPVRLAQTYTSGFNVARCQAVALSIKVKAS